MKIKVLKLGETATEVDAASGQTVADVIKQSGLGEHGYTRTLNGQIVFDSTQVKEGDVITLAPKVEGGNI
jgi:sulfur carrier protein ThiS